MVKGEKEYMIPAVPSFVESIDTAGGLIKVRSLRGWKPMRMIS